jgi:hypothetical protein
MKFGEEKLVGQVIEHETATLVEFMMAASGSDEEVASMMNESV